MARTNGPISRQWIVRSPGNVNHSSALPGGSRKLPSSRVWAMKDMLDQRVVLRAVVHMVNHYAVLRAVVHSASPFFHGWLIRVVRPCLLSAAVVRIFNV